MMGGMGINSIEALRGNRLMLRGVGLTQKSLISSASCTRASNKHAASQLEGANKK